MNIIKQKTILGVKQLYKLGNLTEGQLLAIFNGFTGTAVSFDVCLQIGRVLVKERVITEEEALARIPNFS